MNAARQAVEEYIIGAMAQVMDGNKNPEIYKDFFARLDDDAFEALMDRMERMTNPSRSITLTSAARTSTLSISLG